jgi:hypothetical protein
MKPVKITLITGGQLTDGNQELKERFRTLLAEDWDVDNYEYWIKECLDGNLNKELQDLLVSLGAKLGFDIEYGRYIGKQGEIGCDGIWVLSTGEAIVLEVKAATWPGPDISQLAGYMGQLTQERGWERTKVYGLYIVGDQNVTSLVAQIKGSHPKDMRVIKYQDLLRLYQLKLDLDNIGGLGSGAEKVHKLLLPMENIDVGDFISLILEIAEFKQATQEEPETEEEFIDPLSLTAWSSSELGNYLAECTPIQKALLAILARASEGEWVWRKQIIAEMPALFVQLGVEEHYKVPSGYTIAGAIAGLTMRRKPLGKESIVKRQMGGQKMAIAEQYLPQIRKWLAAQSLA